MSGTKINLVRETLVFIIDELSSRDRLCLIRFSDSVKQLCGFKKMTKENKLKLKKLVNDEVNAYGATDILKAIDEGYQALLSRTTQNETTAMFFLSDGEDTCGNSKVSIKNALIEKHLEMQNKGFQYQTHSFGYGHDHDENVLTMISDQTGGNFYYIKKNEFVDECIIDCFGYLMSMFASEVKLELQLYKGWFISDLFSILWNKKSNKKAELNLHGLAVGKTLNFITELKLKTTRTNLNKMSLMPVARANMTYTYNGKKYTIKRQWKIKIAKDGEDIGEADPEVEENYSKAEGGRVMDKAQKLVKSGKRQRASKVLKSFQSKIKRKKCLNKKFKSKISKTVKMGFVKKRKDFLQVKKMMNENAFNPAYESFSKMNKKQKKLKSKKKKAKI
jgi:hypothetical protein